MVGVPRSTGCALCIKRRIKCDEGKPSCANCKKYGTECPGYDKGLKFVVGKTHRSRRQQRTYQKQQKDNSLSPISPISASPTPSETPSVISLPAVSPTEETSPVELTFQRYDPPEPFLLLDIVSPSSYQEQCLSVVVDHLPRHSADSDILIMSHWMSFLPAQFGRSKALDTAIACFTTQQIGTSMQDQRMLGYGRATYIQALGKLQKAINNPREAASSETLCAAMLLCIYELFAGTTAFDSWVKHAAGIGRLMQYRGPRSHLKDFDHAMLLAFRSIITMECMFSAKVCFLAEKEWRNIGRQTYNPTVPPHLRDLLEDISHYMANLPGLLRDGLDLQAAQKLNKGSPLNCEEVNNLANRTLDLYSQFRAWGVKFTALVPYPKEVLSSMNDHLFPVVFSYEGTSAATVYCAYWGCIIMLQEILAVLGCVPEDAVDDNLLVDNICKSVEYNGEGTWGPFRMAFPLRVAWDIATPSIRQWIVTCHEQWKKIYAATSPEALPDNDQPKITDGDLTPQHSAMDKEIQSYSDSFNAIQSYSGTTNGVYGYPDTTNGLYSVY